MKKLFSRVISIFAVFALISCGLISCSDIENNESGSVSFSISPDLAKAVLDTGRSLRAETDPTGDSSANESPSPYRIEVSLSGGRAETKRHSYTESEWQAIAEKSESVKGKENVTSFTFDNIPVGTQIAISATIFYAQNEQLVYPCMAGKSATLEIQQGDNPVSFNVHRLAMFNLYNNTESGETISDISKLDVYALPKGSEVANNILALVAKDDSKNDPEIYEILSAYSKIYSYSKPDSPYLTGGYELKNGAEVYMLSLLYTSDGVYLGHPDVSSSSETLPQDALTVIKIDDVNNIHLKLMKMDLDYTYIFPAKYEDKEVSAWYVGENYDGQADYHGTPCVKTETSAVFLFSDKTFVITSHKIKKSTSGEEIYEDEIKYVMRGNYELSGDDFANGTFTLTPTAKYVEGRGWVALSEATQEQQKLVCEVTNGKFTPSSMEEPYEFSMKSDSDYLRVYRGKIDDTESGAIAGDISAFFPSSYKDKEVVAWYAYYGSDYTEAVFLFAEGEFVTTKHEYSSNSGEVRRILAAGEYSLSGTPNEYDNNTGYAQFKEGDGTRSPAITITNGVMTVSEMSSNGYVKQSLDKIPIAQDETSEDTPHHSAMDFEITLTNSSVPSSAELYQVSIFAVNESGYSNMSKIGSSTEQKKASVLVETLMDESVGKYLGYYTPKIDSWFDSSGNMLNTPITIDNPQMTVSEDGSSITITDSYTSYGAMQANAPTAIVAIVHYGNLSTYSNFFVGLSEKITTSTSSKNSVSMAVAERNVPVQVNFYAGENPNLLSSCVMAVSTWSTDLNELSKNFSNYLKVEAVANHITEKGYSIPQSTITAGQYSTTAMNGIPCFSVKVSATPYLSYDGSCTNYGTDYNLKLSVYAKSESDGIYSVETVSDGSDSDDSVLVSCGTYTIEKGIVSVLETNYRTDFVSTATLYGADDSKSQTFDSSASSFTLSSGSGVTFTFGEEESDNLDIVFLFETEIGSGKYEELDKLPTLHINADDDIDSIVENYTTQAIMLGYDYNEEKTDSEPEYDKDSKVWIMHIYFDKVEIKEVFSATGQGTSDYITLSEKHSFTLTSYSTLTYEVKYSDGDSIADKVVSKGTWVLSDDESTYTLTETEYFDFSAGDMSSTTLTAVSKPNPQTVSMANLNENGKFSYDSANGVSVMFTVVGDEPETVTIGGVSVTLEKFDTTDLGEKISLSVEKAEDGKSVKITASPDESITVSQYKLILFEGQEQVSLPDGTLDSNTGSYVWTLTENIINNLSAGNHQITVSVTIADKLYTASTDLTITK